MTRHAEWPANAQNCFYASVGCGTTSTEHPAWLSTASDVLPRSVLESQFLRYLRHLVLKMISALGPIHLLFQKSHNHIFRRIVLL